MAGLDSILLLIKRGKKKKKKKKTIYNPSSLMNRSLSQCLFFFFTWLQQGFRIVGVHARDGVSDTRFVYPVLALAPRSHQNVSDKHKLRRGQAR